MDKKVLYSLSYGLYAIGVKDGERDCGCIVNTVFQISGNGPTVALSMNKDNYTYELIKKTNHFTVSILSEETNPDVISRLGFASGKDKDKWEGFAYKQYHDCPVAIEKTIGFMYCEVEKMVDADTHFVIIAKVVDSESDCRATPMTYAYYHNVIKGSAPKKAPTYREESEEEHTMVKKDGKWVCSVCNWVYDGPDFEKESDDYVCPICGAPKDVFEKR